ncbi:hypothetical protein; 23552-23863 [Arabidopsis thaliana]|uniref:Uncharacterized protein T4I21.2 n=1 Tax=Arabidopsis thaliana TaxID=3702 RepID=Q9C8R0_ARATH|nr:hypothetical protein; 23552-23863 [Arabidopsis thaliana]
MTQYWDGLRTVLDPGGRVGVRNEEDSEARNRVCSQVVVMVILDFKVMEMKTLDLGEVEW